MGTTTGLYQYAFLDLGPTVAGVDAVYLADNTSGLVQQWMCDGTAWTQRSTITLASAASRAGPDEVLAAALTVGFQNA